jgi:hypothetical protein
MKTVIINTVEPPDRRIPVDEQDAPSSGWFSRRSWNRSSGYNEVGALHYRYERWGCPTAAIHNLCRALIAARRLPRPSNGMTLRSSLRLRPKGRQI